jgi:beta-lactamase class A
MVYATTPPDTNTNLNNAPTTMQAQQGEAPMSEQTLNNDKNSWTVKELALRKLIDGSVKTNADMKVTTGLQVMDMKDNHLIANHNSADEQFAASINKLAVMLPVLHDLRAEGGGKLKLDQKLTWSSTDVRAGAGKFDQPGAPTTATLKEVIYDMLNRSGNTAVRVVVNKALGGVDKANQRIHSYRELPNTYLVPVAGEGERFFLGNTTAHDSLWAMDQLTAYNDKYARFIKEAMATNIYNEFGVRSQMSGNHWTILINKTGMLNDVDGNNRHDVGIVKNLKTGKRYGYSILTTAPSTDAAATDRADESLKEVGRYILRYTGDKPKYDKHGKEQKMETAPLTEGAKKMPPMEKKVLY